MDTGASLSLLRHDVACEVFKRCGRAFRLKASDVRLTTINNVPIDVLGTAEFLVERVGPVQFQVLKGIKHEAIIGWDQLHKHGWALSDGKTQAMLWGQRAFDLEVTTNGDYETADIEAGCLTELLSQYKQIFGEPGSLPVSGLPELHIDTEAGQLVAQRPYRAALTKRSIIESEIDKMLAMGIIRPSLSPWASPVTLVPKKDGTTRFCIDYRALNSVTVKVRYPLPLVRDIFDQLGGSSIFTTMDMRSGYWQLPVAADSIEKTAFVCHRGQFEFLRMPFGLANAPSLFQRAMNQVLAEYIGKFVMVFLDDIVVYSSSEREHKQHVAAVLKKLSAANLTLKASKCHWGKPKIDLLGYVVTAHGISPQPEKTEAIRALRPPVDIPELRRFLGMTGYYRDLIPRYAHIADPLYALTRKDVEWIWGEKEGGAFETLKAAFTSETVMAHPCVNEPYILYTDACDYAVGGILCQKDKQGIERPIQYISAGLDRTQRNWPVIEKEAYSVIYCLKKLRAYLLGAEFKVLTDHKPLLCLFTKEMVNTKIQRWAVLMAEFGAKVEYRKGKNNVRADMLSRITGQSEMAVFEADEEWVTLEDEADQAAPRLPSDTDDLNDNEVRRAQSVEYQEEIDMANRNEGTWVYADALLYSTARPGQDQAVYPRLMLPSAYRKGIISKCHEESGHAGLLKTLRRIQENYVWAGMRKDVQRHLDRCGLCLVHRARPERPPMGEMPLAQCPGEIVGIDLMGPLFQSSLNDSKYLMVCIDHYSGWVEAYPLRNRSNEAVWERLANDYVPRHGSPKVIITDRGTEFHGPEFEHWLEQNCIEHRRTSGYNPQSNGKTERANETLRRLLEKLCNCERADWENQLGPALTAVRNNVSTVTGYAPFMLHLCRPARHSIGRMVDGTCNPSWGDRLQLQAEIMQKAVRAMEESRRHNRERLERKANAKHLEPGDQVMVKGQRLTPLTSKWDHHFTVTQVRGKVITVLHMPTGKTARYNRNKLRLVDPEVSWEGIRLRPRAQQRVAPSTNVFVAGSPQPQVLLPEKEAEVQLRTPRVPPLVIRRRHTVQLPERGAEDQRVPPLIIRRQHTVRSLKRPAPQLRCRSLRTAESRMETDEANDLAGGDDDPMDMECAPSSWSPSYL